MKILVLGNYLLAQRLVSILFTEGIEATHQKAKSFDEKLIKQKKFDAVIVDSLIEGVEDICDEISSLARIPVILVVKEFEANWKKLSNFDVDGYLTEEAGDIELGARIKALCRRMTLLKS